MLKSLPISMTNISSMQESFMCMLKKMLHHIKTRRFSDVHIIPKISVASRTPPFCL